MSVQIRYMGTKRALAPRVAETIRRLPEGPCLDLFAGMCSVAGALAPSRREVWCNDVQGYACLVSQALVTSAEPLPNGDDVRRELADHYLENASALQARFAEALAAEGEALGGTHEEYLSLTSAWRHVGNDTALAGEAAIVRLATEQGLRSAPYRLFSITFAHGYFGLAQALEIDSIRYAVDSAFAHGRISAERHRWYIVALVQAANHVVSAPGHFAQFLSVRDETTFRRVRELRRRSVFSQFVVELGRIKPFGTEEWRSRNRVFSRPAQALLAALEGETVRPSVVYADPPYTRDQYSRYYHVLETLVRYDYPPASSAGRYRPDRFTSPYSLASKVRGAFLELAAGVAALGAVLVLSYPSSGLFHRQLGDPSAERITDLLAQHFADVGTISIPYHHSTMGARHGHALNGVTERIYVASGPTRS